MIGEKTIAKIGIAVCRSGAGIISFLVQGGVAAASLRLTG